MDWEETLTGSREGWLCAGWLIRHTRTAFIHSMHTAGRLQWNLVTRWGSSGHSRGKGMRAPLPRQIDASMTAGRHAANKARCVRVSAVETHHASPRCSYSLGVFPVRFTKPLAADAGLQDEAVGGVDCVRCHIAQHLLTQRWKRKAFIWIAGQPSEGPLTLQNPAAVGVLCVRHMHMPNQGGLGSGGRCTTKGSRARAGGQLRVGACAEATQTLRNKQSSFLTDRARLHPCMCPHRWNLACTACFQPRATE
jgi:hypothetical protein